MKLNDTNRPFYIDKRKDSVSLSGKWDYDFFDKEQKIENLVYRYTTDLPSSTYKSVFKSGLLPDYLVSDNSKLYRDLKNKVFYYKRFFDVPTEKSGLDCYLCLDGGAYYTDIYVNGKALGTHYGFACGPYINISDKLNYGGENEIVICAKAPCYGNDDFDPWNQNEKSDVIVPWGYSGDSRCNNGDFTMNGIWNEIRLEFVPKVHISRPFLSTVTASDRSAKLRLSLEITSELFEETEINRGYYAYPTDYTFAYDEGVTGKKKKEYVYLYTKIYDENGTLYEKKEKVSLLDYAKSGINSKYYDCQYVERDIAVKNPTLWYPSNMGEPHLYRVEIELYDEEKKLDSHEFDFGIRTVTTEFTKAPRYTFDRQKFQFVINGKRVFLKGVNMMPQDVMLDLEKSAYERKLYLAKSANIGLIRLWGGCGIYETNDFYETCDRYGILVWQDSLIANMTTPKWDVRILDSLVAPSVYRIRNHASLAVYCGGNEFNPYNVGNAGAVGKIRQTTTLLDPTRIFYDTTSLGGSAHIYKDMEPTRYRKMYKELPFVGETGIHSLPCYKSLVPLVDKKEMADKCDNLSVEYLKNHPQFSNHIIENNPERIPRMVSRATQLIDVENADIKALCEATQIASNEYYQFMCDAFVENYPNTAGLMPWVFSRPWATVGIQLVDAVGFACMQYYAVKKCYEDVTAMLCLDEVTYGKGEKMPLKCAVINHRKTPLSDLDLTVTLYSPQLEKVYRYTQKVSTNAYKKYVTFTPFTIPDDYEDKFFFVNVELSGNGIQVYKVYKPKCLKEMADKKIRDEYRNGMENNFVYTDRTVQSKQIENCRTKLTVSAKSKDNTATVTIKNVGKHPAYPVILDSDSTKPVYPSDNCFMLDPNKSVTLTVDLYDSKAKKISLHGWNFDKVETQL